jgi:acetyl/propionyl-CoA carboxylase alpha subunit
MRRALGEYDICGLTTNLDFQRRLLTVEDFVRGTYDTGFIELHKEQLLGNLDGPAADEKMAAAVLAVALGGRDLPGQQSESGNGAGSAGNDPSPWQSAHRRHRLRL